MSPTVDDLRHALHDAASGPAPAPGRLTAVRRAVVRRRRTRVAGSVVAALVLAGGAVGVTDTLSSRRAEQPAFGRQGGLPTFAGGGRLVAQVRLSDRVGDTTSFTFTPTSWGLSLVDRCEVAGASALVDVRVNGRPTMTGGCGAGSRGSFEDDAPHWRSLGVRLGEASTVSVRIMSPDEFPAASADSGNPKRTAVLAGVYQDVALSEYPLPPRPAQVRAPNELSENTFGMQPGATLVRAESASGTGTQTVTVPYSPDLELYVVTWAPGLLRFTVDGHRLAGTTSWDYDQSDFGGPTLSPATLRAAGVTVPRTGQPLTLTIETERFTDPGWQVSIGRQGTSQATAPPATSATTTR